MIFALMIHIEKMKKKINFFNHEQFFDELNSIENSIKGLILKTEKSFKKLRFEKSFN